MTTTTTIIDTTARHLPTTTTETATQLMPIFSAEKASTLIAGHGTAYASYDELRRLPEIAATRSWQPIRFDTLIDTLHDRLAHRGIAVPRESYALSHDGLKMFATFELAYGADEERTAAIGLRSSNNKTMSIQLAVGTKVFVCANMTIKGDLIALKRKHTSKLNLESELDRGLDKYFAGYERMTHSIKRMKALTFGSFEAERMIFRAFDLGVLPIRLFHAVIASYRDIQRNAFVTCWQLHNCFTLHAQELPPQRQFQANLDIGKFFSL